MLNDGAAVGFMFELRWEGIHVPGKVGAVGYDDVCMFGLPLIDLSNGSGRKRSRRPTTPSTAPVPR